MSTPVVVPPGPADDRTVASIARVARERHPNPWPDAAVLALTARIERDQVAITATRGALLGLARNFAEDGDTRLNAASSALGRIIADLDKVTGGDRR